MKRLAVVNRVPDLSRFFQDGQDLIGFDTLDEAVEKVVYYHTHPDEAQVIAGRGYEAVKHHTWDNRITQILDEIV